jgi:GT2 family glycosyltransferase
MHDAPRVSVVIPTWNGVELLAICLPSLAVQTWRDFEVIVVDNGSTDGTDSFLRREHPHVRYVRFEENRGFAAGVNAGIRAARGEVVALMNNDTEAAPGWLAALVGALDRTPEVGFCASRMVDFHDRTRIDSAGDTYGILADQIGHGAPDGPAFDQPRRVLSASAGAAAYRRELFDRVGLFDERLGTYLEDIDLGLRAQLAGFQCEYVPDAVIYHMGSATASRASARKTYQLTRNSLFLFFQYMPRGVLLRWGGPMLAWPFYYAVRQRASPVVALRALRDLFAGLPAVVRRRREIARTRVLPDASFRALLGPPVGPGGAGSGR